MTKDSVLIVYLSIYLWNLYSSPSR